MREDDAAPPGKPSANGTGDRTVRLEPEQEESEPEQAKLVPSLERSVSARAQGARRIDSAEVATIKLLAEDPSEAYLPTRSESFPVERSRSVILIAGFAAGLGLFVSFGRHLLEAPGEDPGPAVAEMPRGPDGEVAVFRGVAPSDQERAAAQALLAESEDALRARSLGEARRKLIACVVLADLPDCHRQLGSLLGLTGDHGGRAHLKRYLELAPNAPDAPTIRAIVTASATVASPGT